jgi:hypothetical protein
MDTFIFNVERLKNNFTKLNRYNVVNVVWKGDNTIKGLCQASKSGHGSNLFDKLLPTSYYDFYNKLTLYANENYNKLTIYNRGLTYNEVVELANEFKTNVESLDNTIQFEICDYIDYIYYVNVIQTFDGHINEIMLVDYINKYWYKDAHKAFGELDSKYGVDVLYNEDKKGIQVKSINFFLGNKQSVVNDRMNIKTLKDEVEKLFNIKMYYAIFDRKTNKYLKSKNNTPVFSYEEFKELLECKIKPHTVLKYPQMSV